MPLVELNGVPMTEEVSRVTVTVQWGILPSTISGIRDWSYDREDLQQAHSWENLMQPAYESFRRHINPDPKHWVSLQITWV